MSAKARSAWTMFAAGVATGVGVGWLAFARTAPAVAPETDLSAGAASQPQPSVAQREPRSRATSPPATDAPMAPAPAPVDPRMAGGPRPHGGTLTDAKVDEVIAGARTAAADGDGEAFVRALETLATSSNVRAHAYVVEVLGDERIALGSVKTNMFDDLQRWFEKRGPIPGLAAAARRRYASKGADGGVWWAVDGLFRLVAEHGDAGDIAWIDSLTDDGRTQQMARSAIFRSPRPEAAQAVERMLLAGDVPAESLVEFARANPATAAEVTARLVRDADLGLPKVAKVDRFALLRGYAVAAQKGGGSADGAREVLLSLHDPDMRLAAIEAVGVFWAAKQDISPYQPLIDEMLNRLTTGEALPELWERCNRLVDSCRVLWNAKTADVLESAAARDVPEDTKESLLRAAERIRTELAKPWRRK